MVQINIQGSAKRRSPGCGNVTGEARQKWLATAVAKFTKPGDCLFAELCREEKEERQVMRQAGYLFRNMTSEGMGKGVLLEAEIAARLDG